MLDCSVGQIRPGETIDLPIVRLAPASARSASRRARSTTTHCGTERWPVKTLEAGPYRRDPVQPATVTQLTEIMPPTREMLDHANTSRFAQETVVYQVTALLIGYKVESDTDYHLVFADPASPQVTMIGEIPSPKCSPAEFGSVFAGERVFIDSIGGKATAKFRRLAKPVPVVVTGVGFFDFLHGQTGVAPNGFELHPVLAIEPEVQR